MFGVILFGIGDMWSFLV